MLNSCATALANILFRKCPVTMARKEVYIYGLELTLSSAAVAFSVLILSCVFGAVYTSFIFSFVFVSIRLFAGGYHAKKYVQCFVLSNAVYLICLGITFLFEYLKIEIICPGLTLLSMAVIFKLAPIKHKHHPLSERAYLRNKTISRIVTACDGLCILAAFYYPFMPYLACMGSATMAATAVLMVIPKFQERSRV